MEPFNRRIIQSLFGESLLHVWVLEYGITHFQMRLAIHKGDYPRSTELLCTGCIYFCGNVQGGPYRLQLNELPDGLVEIIGDDGELRIQCESIRLGKTRS